MGKEAVAQWTFGGLLEEISIVDRELKDRSIAFVIGAGASVSSGIPTASHLAESWLAELHERACLDYKNESIDAWLGRGGAGIKGLAVRSQAGSFYPQIFEKRFGGDPEAGYAALEDLMEGRWPSIGYSMLAEILHHTRHKVVVTTNFDNLVADALAMHGHKAPLVVAHESLTGFVRPQLRRPLVAKIHRDLLLHPKNDQSGVARMEAGWKDALRNLFRSYQPVVIGYGGNDGSLMGLLQSLEREDLAGPIWWCRMRNSPLPPAVEQLLAKHHGISVEAPPFDELMLRLAERIVEGLDLAGMSQRIERLGRARTQRYRDGAEDVAESLGRKDHPDPMDCGRLARDNDHWWSWILRAMSKEESEESADERDKATKEESKTEREKAFQDATRKLAGTGLDTAMSSDRPVEPRGANARVLARYARSIAQRGGEKNKVRAHDLFRQALLANQADPFVISNYAHFLQIFMDDAVEALRHYKVAYELDPVDDWNVSNYAICLDLNAALVDKIPGKHHNPEELFDRALALAPDDVRHRHNKAFFLYLHGAYEEAEKQYRKALLLDPTDARTIFEFSWFLFQQDRVDEAEAIFKRAYASDHGSAAIRGEYANFLAYGLSQYDKAERFYLEAISLADKKDIQWLRVYANFLWIVRHDAHTAEERYKELRKLDSHDPDTAANLASLLLTRHTEIGLDDCVKLADLAVTLCWPIPRQACAEALLYRAIAADLKKEDALPYLAKLKWVLDKRYPRAPWDFKPLEGVLVKVGKKRRSLYEKLKSAILRESEVPALADEPVDQGRTWAKLGAIDPFASPAVESPRTRHRPSRAKAAHSAVQPNGGHAAQNSCSSVVSQRRPRNL